jgi:magnesium chelatase family protein
LGGLSIAVCAQQSGIKNLLVPSENAAEAAVVKDIQVFGLRHPAEVVQFLIQPLGFTATEASPDTFQDNAVGGPDFSDVRGQTTATRALEVAAGQPPRADGWAAGVR